MIKRNQNLSQQLDHMDVKIGLLIQNRVSLQVTRVDSRENKYFGLYAYF